MKKEIYFCSMTKKVLVALIVALLLGVLVSPNTYSISAEEISSVKKPKLNIVTDYIITEHETIIDLRSLDEFLVRETYNFVNPNNYTLSSMNLWFDYLMKNITISDKEGILNYDIVEIGDSSNVTINFDRDLYNETDYSLYLEYHLSESPIYEIEDYYLFQFTSGVNFETDLQKVKLMLPYGCILHCCEFDSVSPDASFSMPQNRVYLEWEFEGLNPNDENEISVYFDFLIQKTYIWIIIVGPLLGLSVGIVGSFLFMRRRRQKTVKKLAEVFLSKTQKEILSILEEKGGKIPQVELAEITGYSKSNISRTLIPLEEKGIIRKKKVGRNHIIYLTDENHMVSE